MFKMQISAETDIGSRPYPFIFFKGGLSQNLLSPFWSTLSNMLCDLWQEKGLTVKKCELKQLVAC